MINLPVLPQLTGEIQRDIKALHDYLSALLFAFPGSVAESMSMLSGGTVQILQSNTTGLFLQDAEEESVEPFLVVGRQGLQGKQGLQGPPGFDAEETEIQIPLQGPPGQQGPSGQQGMPGLDGENAEEVWYFPTAPTVII